MKKIHKKAFSLIELSIVLVIIAIIIAGSLSASTVSISNAKTKTSSDKIEQIYKALGNYVSINFRLPCPARMDLTKTSGSYGAEAGTAGSCSSAGVYQSSTQNTILYGMVPVQALGLSADMAEDGFGNRFAYIVNKDMTAAEYPSTTLTGAFSGHSETDSTTLRLLQVSSSNTIDGNAFAIISYGVNGFGAFKGNSTTQNAASSDTYEQQNYVSSVNTGTTPYTADFGVVTGHTGRVVITYSNLSSDVFDDIVFAKSRTQMALDFKAMFLIPCATSGNYSAAYYGQISYSSAACSSPHADITPTKRCGAYGLWLDEQTCP